MQSRRKSTKPKVSADRKCLSFSMGTVFVKTPLEGARTSNDRGKKGEACESHVTFALLLVERATEIQ